MLSSGKPQWLSKPECDAIAQVYIVSRDAGSDWNVCAACPGYGRHDIAACCCQKVLPDA